MPPYGVTELVLPYMHHLMHEQCSVVRCRGKIIHMDRPREIHLAIWGNSRPVTLEAEQHPVSVVVNLYFRVVHRIAIHEARNSQLALGQLSLMALRPVLVSRLPQTSRIGPDSLGFADNLVPAIAAVERTAESHTVW